MPRTPPAPRPKPKPSGATKAPVQPLPAATLHRSGAVARMLRMPVATLRVWERRYALTNTAQSPSGQRLYSADDVQRLTLLKQLTDLGHAIGSLAALNLVQLRGVARTHAQALAATQTGRRASPDTPAGTVANASGAHLVPTRVAGALRLVVVGKALAARLHRPALLRQLGLPLELVGPFDTLAQAAAAMAARPRGPMADAWLLHEPQLHPDWLTAFDAAMPSRGRLASRPPIALVFGMAADRVCEALAARQVTLLREPQPDVALAQWLRQWMETAAFQQARQTRSNGPSRKGTEHGPSRRLPPRRWDDSALTDFAALSTSVACECPRQLAELLMQLSSFESYSALCQHRNPADAELHAHLGRVVGDARAAFEAALEHVALHEGLLLPASLG